jgi:5-methylcytosine-specific restriction endonuclease McrA
MRPINKGNKPASGGGDDNPNNQGLGRGQRKKKQKTDDAYIIADVRGAGKNDLYGTFRGPLIARLGKYCSYCEIPMGTGLQVEHKDPKSQSQNIYSSTDWNNLVLACPACNYTKKDHPKGNETLDDFVWPDGLVGDNNNNNAVSNKVQFSPDPNLSTFVYTLHTNVAATLTTTDANGNAAVQNLPPQDAVIVTPGNNQAQRAQLTINMLNLNGGYSNNALAFYTQASDRRIQYRTAAWKYALAAAQRLNTVNQACPGNTRLEVVSRQAIERQIVSTAVSAGFWSVWVTVFHQEYAAQPSRLTLAQGDTIQKLLGRLFLRGTEEIDIRFVGTDAAMIGVQALGDIAP